jgi:hypothetical protein
LRTVCKALIHERDVGGTYVRITGG